MSVFKFEGGLHNALRPIKQAWIEIVRGLRASSDKEGYGVVHQNIFMKAIRAAGDLNKMSDGEFLTIIVGNDPEIRDTRGFINYANFAKKILLL